MKRAELPLLHVVKKGRIYFSTLISTFACQSEGEAFRYRWGAECWELGVSKLEYEK